jgi:hemolysin activation/secretion protein
MNRNQKIGTVVPLLVACLICAGASEFPQTNEFPSSQGAVIDEALEDDEFFDEEIQSFNIDKVSERRYGEEDLSRLPVEDVVIAGVVPYPEHQITQEQVQELIYDSFEIQQDIELDDNGFTRRDLQDIGRFLRDIADRGDEPDEEDLAELVRMVERQEEQRGWLTIEQLDNIALEVTNYYRSNGFILATAFIPEQEVTDGVVRLGVLEGRLGDVTVSNNEIFSSDTISAAFSKNLGDPVTEEAIESTLRRINDLPGVSVRGSFSPGQNVGETSLNLGVMEEKSWTASVLMDNHGSEITGQNRAFATGQWLNMAGRGHRFLIGVLQSEGPDSTTYGLAEYELPVTRDQRGKIKFGASTNQFAVAGLANLPEITGETDNYSISGSYQILRGRTRNFSVQTGITRKDVLFEVGELVSLSTNQTIDVFSLSADYLQLLDEQQLMMTGRLGIEEGHIVSGVLPAQSGYFTKAVFSANILKRFSLTNWFTENESYYNFVAKFNGQYSEKFLSSVEQFSLGGPNAVRAFSISDVSVDAGIYAGFELYFDLPWDPTQIGNSPLDPIKPYIFYDYGYGTVVGAAGSDRDAEIKGWGLGFRLNWPGYASLNFVFSKPQSAKYEDDFIAAQGESRIFVDLTYTFH